MATVTSFTAAAAPLLLVCMPLATAGPDDLTHAVAQPSGIVVPAPTGRPNRAQDTTSILVRFKPVALQNRRAATRAQINGTRLRAYKMISGLELVRLSAGTDVEQALAILRRLPFVAYAHPNHVIYLDQQLPSDAYFDEQWALHNTGQASGWGVWPAGTPDADIDWPPAWNNASGNGSVVAVLDTGIDYRHSDLAPNVWQNLAEVNGTPGIDDDGNGYIDDIRGWDFVNNDNDPLDGHGHGTHVAGSIAAVVDNGNGIAGVMWNGRVMALKILDDQGYGLLSDAIAALEYATARGVRISNNSWGYSNPGPGDMADHQALYDAIAAAAAVDHLVVAAAGNDTVDTDSAPHYPSAFDLDNIIAVAATDNNDQLAWFSNWGAVSVDMAAPGEAIFSTYKLYNGSADDYAWMNGTSMATPHVSGAAGLLAGLPDCATWQQVRDQILDHVRSVGSLSGITVTGGLLDISATLNGNECAPVGPPLTVNTNSLPDASIGLGYSVRLDAVGGTPPYAWSVVGGILPPGLALSGDGWITGTAIAPAAAHAFTVQVTDANGTMTSQALNLLVKRAVLTCGYCHAAGGF